MAPWEINDKNAFPPRIRKSPVLGGSKRPLPAPKSTEKGGGLRPPFPVAVRGRLDPQIEDLGFGGKGFDLFEVPDYRGPREALVAVLGAMGAGQRASAASCQRQPAQGAHRAFAGDSVGRGGTVRALIQKPLRPRQGP